MQKNVNLHMKELQMSGCKQLSVQFTSFRFWSISTNTKENISPMVRLENSELFPF